MQCLYPTRLEHHLELSGPASVRVNTSVKLVHALLGTMSGPVHPVLKHGPRSLTCLRAHRLQPSMIAQRKDWLVYVHLEHTFSLMESVSVSVPARTRNDGELGLWKAIVRETLAEHGVALEKDRS